MDSYDGVTTAYEAYLRGAKLSGKMKVNRTQIRTFLTDDVIMTSQFVAMTTKV